MKVAIYSVTRGGGLQGKRIKAILPEAKLYVMKGLHEAAEGAAVIDRPLKELVKEDFFNNDLLIFIMAAGIAVRLIAPHLQHKVKDPAVLVMDEEGQNIISLLSGHVGGANLWAKRLGQELGARPIITTASDLKGLMAVDMLALENQCNIIDWEKAKRITAYIVDGGYVGLFTEGIEPVEAPPNYIRVHNFEELRGYSYGLFISNRELGCLEEKIIQLYPRNLAIGIGCRAGTDKSDILREIYRAFSLVGRSINSISKLYTIELKAKEKGLLEAAEELKVPIEIVSLERIKAVEGQFQGSTFVAETVGVKAVSGPCAYIGSEGGTMLIEKHRNNGVTVSIAEINCGVME